MVRIFNFHRLSQLGKNENESRRASIKSDYKGEKNFMDSFENCEHVRREPTRVDESPLEFQAKREREFELSSSLIHVCPEL